MWDDIHAVSTTTLLDTLSIQDIRVDYIRTDKKLADPLIKRLAREKIYKPSKGIRLLPLKRWVTCDGNPTYGL